jgi:prevent-host-death family protein
MSTVVVMTEIPDGELREHVSEILRRVEAGEELVVTMDGRPVAELRPVQDTRPRAVSLKEFLSWPKADRSMLDDIRDVVGDETTDDIKDPWA